MPTITIDNLRIDVPEGTTVLDAARKAGISIPTLCHRAGHPPLTSCLVCVVKVNGGQRLVPSCGTKVMEGMVVESESPEVREARKTALELLLADHTGDCVAPCQSICPAKMNIPRMLDLIAEGRLREALITVKEAIALPAVLGRICPELCERGCRRGDVDQPVAICKLKRHVADDDLASSEPYLPVKSAPTGKKVAIVGAGPAGLAAAYYLLALGHACTILDDHPEPGGALRYSVPADLLPPAVLDAEIAGIFRLGATFRGNYQLGRDGTTTQLMSEFDAVLVAVGPADPAKATALGLPTLAKGLDFDRHSLATRTQGLFVAGALITPHKHAVRSVADGRTAAVSIHQFLTGQNPAGSQKMYSVHIGRLHTEELAVALGGITAAPRAAADPTTRALPREVAGTEASRCLNCQCSADVACALRKFAAEYHANQRRFNLPRRPLTRVSIHPGITYERSKCIACGLCVQVTEEAGELLGLTFIGRGFDIQIGVPLSAAGHNALQNCAVECVRVCPTGALSLIPSISTRME